jgi:hypothetical protein
MQQHDRVLSEATIIQDSGARTVHNKNAQAALKLVERQARRLRAAEAKVQDLRLALDQEIAMAIDTTRATLTDIAAAAGKPRQSCHDALEREDLRRKPPGYLSRTERAALRTSTLSDS